MAMTEYWRMGATPVPATEIAGFARRFEEWGWDGMAIGEAHGLLPDPYVVLGQAAAATTTIKVGTAVAVPLRRRCSRPGRWRPCRRSPAVVPPSRSGAATAP